MSETVVDELDNKIINVLRKDARRSNLEIARILGVSEGTVRRRIGKLVKSGTGKILFAVNPIKLGFLVDALIGLHVEPNKVELLGKKLVEFEEVNYVGLTTGDYDIFIHVLFRSNDELFDFVQHKLSRLPGITRTNTFHVYRILKRADRLMPIGQESDRSKLV